MRKGYSSLASLGSASSPNSDNAGQTGASVIRNRTLAPVLANIDGQGQGSLAQIIKSGGLFCLGFCLGQSRQQQGRHNRDDDQQFNQGESPLARFQIWHAAIQSELAFHRLNI